METGSILIKESVNALQNVRQGVSKCFGAQVLELREFREFIEVYIDNKVYSLSYSQIDDSSCGVTYDHHSLDSRGVIYAPKEHFSTGIT